MRYVVEPDHSRMQYKVYQIKEADGKRFAVYEDIEDNTRVLRQLEITPGAEIPVFMRLDMPLADVLIAEVLGRERPVLEAERALLTQHRDDAIETRDRLLAMLEHVESRTTR